MPEGHTIHMLAADHRRQFGGKKLTVSSPQGRFTDAKLVTGRMLKDVHAYGKNLFYDFGKARIIHVHLGLHGKFKLTPLTKGGNPPEPRGAVRMRFLTPAAVLDLNGPIRCEIVNEETVKKVIAKLGPDVLDPNADPARAWNKISKSSSPLAILLMDQSIIAGIGNAYRCEILYRQRLHPLLPGKSLPPAAFKKLWTDAVHLLTMGIKHRQAWAVDETDISNPPSRDDGQPDRYNVYRREKCRNCQSKIKVLPLAGRRCFYCPKEQKPDESIRLRHQRQLK